MLLLFYLHYRVHDCECVCVCGCAESPRGTRAHELQRVGFSSWGPCDLGALWHVGSFEPESPALEGRFLTSGPPGKSLFMFKWLLCIWFRQWLEREKHLRYLTQDREQTVLSMEWWDGLQMRVGTRLAWCPGTEGGYCRLFSRKGSALPDEEVASPRWPLPVQAPPATLPCLPVSGLPTMSIGLTLTSSVVWVKSFLLSEPLSPSEDGWSGMRWESCVYVFSWISRVRHSATPWTIARQAPLSMGFSRQEYWSGLPCPPPGDLPDPEIEPGSPAAPSLAGGFFTHWATWEGPDESQAASGWCTVASPPLTPILTTPRNVPKHLSLTICSEGQPSVIRVSGREKCPQENEPVFFFLFLKQGSLCCRNLYSRNQAPYLESWRTQVYYASGPRGVNTPSSEPQTKGLQNFYTRTGMIKWVCRFAGARRLQRAGQGWVR